MFVCFGLLSVSPKMDCANLTNIDDGTTSLDCGNSIERTDFRDIDLYSHGSCVVVCVSRLR